MGVYCPVYIFGLLFSVVVSHVREGSGEEQSAGADSDHSGAVAA